MKNTIQWFRSNIVTIGLLLILTLFAFGFAPFSWTFPVMKGITAEISTDGQHLIVKNGNDFLWENATITVNQSYHYQIELVPRGGTTIPLNEFQNSVGEPFDSKNDSLRAVTINVPRIYNGQVGLLEW